MQLRLLGPVELVNDDGAIVEIGPGKRRAVLAVLGLEANQIVPTSRLVDLLWDGRPPPKARTALQGHVSALRRVLGPGLSLVTRGPGYELRADPDSVDAVRFRALTAAADSGGPDAADHLRAALDLWRGPALADLVGHGLRATITASLDDARRDALVALAEHCLRAGRGAELLRELRAATTAAPLHEPLIRVLMLCLHQADRQADALEVYHGGRHLLADTLGVDPGGPLQAAYLSVLGEPGRAAGAIAVGGAPAASAIPAIPAIDAAPAVDAVHTVRLPPPEAETAGPGTLSKSGATDAGDVDGAGAPIAPSTSRMPDLVPVPAQLPRVPSGFCGRHEELAWLRARLGRDGLAVVTGPAGVGKTSLVLCWAHAIADRFPGGQLHVNLRGFDHAGPLPTDTALAGFLRALGVPDAEIPASTSERADLYRTRMAGRSVLVVLDNAHDAEQVRPLLPGGSRCQVVVTSRNRLDGLIARDGASSLTVPVLTEDESLDVLSRVLGEARVEAEPVSAARIARLCDNMPLALRVAASRLIVSPHWTLADLAGELQDEQTRLAALSTEEPDTSVEAALSLTYRVLPEEVARLFRMIGLHQGVDIDQYAAAALAEVSPAAARPALTALAGCHLTQQTTPGRFTSHDLVRLYARTLALQASTPEERSAARERLLDYYVETTHAAWNLVSPTEAAGGKESRPHGDGRVQIPPLTDPAGAFAWFRAEEPTIRTLVTSTDDHPDRIWRIARNCVALYTAAGNRDDQITCMTAGVRAARAAQDRAGLFQLLARLGPILGLQGQPGQAVACLEEAAGLIDGSLQDVDRFDLLYNLANVECMADRWEQAQAHYEQARHTAEQLGMPSREAVALNALAWNCVLRDEAERGLAQTGRALELIKDLPVGALHLGIVDTQASALAWLGRLEKASAAYRVVIDTARANGYQKIMASACYGLGEVLIRLDRKPEAEQQLRLALTLFGRQGMSEAEEVRALLTKTFPGE